MYDMNTYNLFFRKRYDMTRNVYKEYYKNTKYEVLCISIYNIHIRDATM